MFVGHGVLAFAIAASVATHRGWTSDRALLVGVVAGLFATLPDVDMVYALLGVLSGAEGLFAASDAFWGAASVVHRAVTHSLVLGAVAAVGFAAWRGRSDPRLLALALVSLGGLVGAVAYVSGPIALVVVGVVVLAGLGIVRAARSADFGPAVVCWTAALGLLSHPFGDLFTGTPPQFLYPVEATLLAERLTLHPDPTLHLLGAFFVELATLWLGLVVLARLRGWDLSVRVSRRAGLGVGYAGAVFALPAPTLEVSWPFVFSVLAVGLLGVPIRAREETGRTWYALATALTAVTVAALAYTTAYMLVDIVGAVIVAIGGTAHLTDVSEYIAETLNEGE